MFRQVCDKMYDTFVVAMVIVVLIVVPALLNN